MVAAASAALAQEQPLRFVHALQENGYGDMAVEYLKTLEKQPDLPPEIRDVWDLEMSKSLKAAAESGLRRQGTRAVDGGVAEVFGEVSSRRSPTIPRP